MNPVEPVSIDFFKEYSRLNTGTGEDAVLALLLGSAREMAEAYCHRPFVSKTLSKTLTIDQPSPVPVAAILSVSGFYTTVEEVADATAYFVNYTKGIIVSRDYPLDYDNLPTYTITYQVEIDPASVPAAVKLAICKIAADLYENRENSSPNVGKELSITYKTMLAPYRIYSKKREPSWTIQR